MKVKGLCSQPKDLVNKNSKVNKKNAQGRG